MVEYYDLVLGGIPAALFGITALMTTSGFGLTTAVPVASTVALGLMGHAMFVNAPDASRTVDRIPDSPARESSGNTGVAPPNAD